MSPVKQPTHNKDDKCCRWAPYRLPEKKPFVLFWSCSAHISRASFWCRVQRTKDDQAEVWHSSQTLHSRFSTSSQPAVSLLELGGCCCCLPGCWLALGPKRWERGRKKASCFNHVYARETAAERLLESMLCCSHFLTASINSTCSYIDCRVLSATTLHLSGHTVWEQPSLLLLKGGHFGPASGCEPWQVELKSAWQSAD